MNLPAVHETELEPKTREWADKITESWRDTVNGIIETGKLILAAKLDLAHGQFGAMIALALPFTSRTAQRLMKIASDHRLIEDGNVRYLPADWYTLYQITRLNDETFDARIEDGTINPGMGQRDIAKVVKLEKRAAREKKLAEKILALPDKKYGVIVADPEWRFEPWSRETGLDRAADNHYPTSVTTVIAQRDVLSIAYQDCVLALWATYPMMPHALLVMAAWGFDYKSQLVWYKRTADEKPALGTGYWFRDSHELLLLGTRGKVVAPAQGQQRRSVLEAKRGEHSKKPDEFYRLIETWYPNVPRIELNARVARPGWAVWGDEVAPEGGAGATDGGAAGASIPAPAAPPANESDGIPPFLRRTKEAEAA
jgi:N6-adenosine-specific RNA methylase IME4